MELRTIRRMFFHPGMILFYFLLQLRMCCPKIRFDHTRSISRCLICLPSCLICSINSDFGSKFFFFGSSLCDFMLCIANLEGASAWRHERAAEDEGFARVVVGNIFVSCKILSSILFQLHLKKSDFRTPFLSTPHFLVFTDVHLICTINTLHMGKSVSKNSTWKGNLFISSKRGE